MPRTVEMQDAEVPVAEAAMALGWTRERVVRAIQTRTLAGGLRSGRWLVQRDSLERLIAQREDVKRSAVQVRRRGSAAQSPLPPAA